MLMGSFWAAPKVPQEKMLAMCLVRVAIMLAAIGSFCPTIVPLKGALALNWYVSVLVVWLTVKA